MSELADVVGGNTITASFTNEVKERSLMRYSNAAARDASIPAPVAGSLAWLEDTALMTVYHDGTGPDSFVGWRIVLQQPDITAFVSLIRGAAVADVTPSIGVWTNYGASLNLGSASAGVQSWVTAAVTSSVLSDVADSVYRMRVGISVNAGSSFTYLSEPWGTSDPGSRRQVMGASSFQDIGSVSQEVRVQAQVFWVSGNEPTFIEGSLTATLAKTSGRI